VTGGTMRAAIYRGKGDLEVVEIAVPPVGPSEVRVAVEYCGVCGTDLHDVLDGWGVSAASEATNGQVESLRSAPVPVWRWALW